MGLFGGSSKSSVSSVNEQTTIGTSGVVTGDALLVSGGDNTTVTNEFGSNVSSAFKSLVDLTGNALSLAGDSFKTSLTATQNFAAQASQPDLDLLKTYSKFLPWVLIAGVAGVVIVTVKK